MRLLKWIAPWALSLAAVSLGRAPAQEFDGGPSRLPVPPAYDIAAGEEEFTTISTANFDNIMERLEALEASAKDEKKAEDDGWIDTSKDKWVLKYGGRAQWDYVNFPEQDLGSRLVGGDLDDYWEIRRLRFHMEGEGYGVWEFKVELDFEPEGVPQLGDSGVALREVWVGMKDVCCLDRWRIGHFKEVFSLEQLTSSRFISFMERSMCDQAFVPGFSLGTAVGSYSNDESLVWQYGAYFPPSPDDVDELDHERISDSQGIDVVGRVCTSPWYCEGGRYFMHLGAGAYYRAPVDGLTRFRSRPETHEESRFIDSGVLAIDDYWVGNLEGALVYGPLSLQSEFFYADVGNPIQTTGPTAGTQLNGIEYYGAYAYVSYFLTGENRGYIRKDGRFDRVTPHTNFWLVPTCDGCCHGCGAWEVLFRWSWLDLSGSGLAPTAAVAPNTGIAAGTPGAGEETNFTLGVNWYWNPYVKMMFNYTKAFNEYDLPITIGGVATTVDDAETDILGMSIRWDF
jgi:phosphate-selective porin OprO/OprP